MFLLSTVKYCYFATVANSTALSQKDGCLRIPTLAHDAHDEGARIIDTSDGLRIGTQFRLVGTRTRRGPSRSWRETAGGKMENNLSQPICEWRPRDRALKGSWQGYLLSLWAQGVHNKGS